MTRAVRNFSSYRELLQGSVRMINMRTLPWESPDLVVAQERLVEIRMIDMRASLWE